MKRNQMLYKPLLFPIIFLFSLTAASQPDTLRNESVEPEHHYSVQLMYQYGHVFATNTFLKGLNAEAEPINKFDAFSTKLSYQTTGKNDWEQEYKYPQYGIGAYIADFHEPEQIGYPVAVYGFFNAPFLRGPRLSFNYEIGFGATFNWEAYNPVTNQYNVAIGAGESFLIDAGLNIKYLMSKRLELITGFSLTHFSNGALRKPNFGINTVAPKICLQYNFFDKNEFMSRPLTKFTAGNEWLVSVYGGIKNVIFDSVDIPVLEKYEGLYFPVLGISGTFNRQVSFKSKIGLGATLSYNGAVNAQAAVEHNELDAVDGKIMEKIMFSIYPSYELVVDRASLIVQPAFYLYRKKLANQSPVFHQRIGLKYYLTNKVFIGITLVDYKFHVSDFIEWTVGYRMRRR